MSDALVYTRKPSRISRERTTRLEDGVLTGENGRRIALDEIRSLQLVERFDGTTKLLVRGQGATIAITSHHVSGGRIAQQGETVRRFQQALEDAIDHPYTRITGSNLWFGMGVATVALGLIGGVLFAVVVFGLGKTPDRPLRGLAAVAACLVIGSLIVLKGRARRERVAG